MDEHVENVVTNVVDEIIDIVSSHLDGNQMFYLILKLSDPSLFLSPYIQGVL